MSDSHDHAHIAVPQSDDDRRRMRGGLVLLGTFTVGEVVAALFAHSLALAADAGHLLVDIGAIAAALYAAQVARRPATPTMTFGYRRSEILAATANAIGLLVMSAALVLGAILRVVHPPVVHGVTVAVVAAIGVVVNLAVSAVLSSGDRSSLNVEAVVQHVMTDLAGFVATLVAGIVIATTGFLRADAIASLAVAALMVRAAVLLLRPAVRILAEAAPAEIDLAEVRSHMLGLDYVRSVHDLHAWTVSSGLPILSAHVVLDDLCASPDATHQVLDELQGCLSDHFDLAHSTIQLEVAGHVEHELDHHD